MFLAACAADSSVKHIKSAQELKTKMDAHEVLVIHALNAENYASGHVPGALNVDYEKMKPEMLPADKNAAIVFYCSGPMCPVSRMAANKAVKWGYVNVWVYEGGMKDWQSSGMAVAKGSG
jgi:rhodanese-related sulfurtransferase